MDYENVEVLRKIIEGNEHTLIIKENEVSLNIKYFDINITAKSVVDIINQIKNTSILNKKISLTYSEGDFVKHHNHYGMQFFMDIKGCVYRTYCKNINHNETVYSLYDNYESLKNSSNYLNSAKDMMGNTINPVKHQETEEEMHENISYFDTHKYTDETEEAFNERILRQSVIKNKEHMDTSIIEEAKNLLNNDRRKDYGKIEDGFNDIATISNILLKRKNIKLDAEDISTIMIATKLVREGNKHKRDNLVDAIGYINIKNVLLNK